MQPWQRELGCPTPRPRSFSLGSRPVLSTTSDLFEVASRGPHNPAPTILPLDSNHNYFNKKQRHGNGSSRCNFRSVLIVLIVAFVLISALGWWRLRHGSPSPPPEPQIAVPAEIDPPQQPQHSSYHMLPPPPPALVPPNWQQQPQQPPPISPQYHHHQQQQSQQQHYPYQQQQQHYQPEPAPHHQYYGYNNYQQPQQPPQYAHQQQYHPQHHNHYQQPQQHQQQYSYQQQQQPPIGHHPVIDLINLEISH